MLPEPSGGGFFGSLSLPAKESEQGARHISALNGSFNIDLGAGIGTSYVNGKGFVRNDGTSGVSLRSCLQGFSDLSNSSNLPALPVNNNQDASTTPELPQAILPKDPSDYIPEDDVVNTNPSNNTWADPGLAASNVVNNVTNPAPNVFNPANVAYNEIGQQVPLTDMQNSSLSQKVDPNDHISIGSAALQDLLYKNGEYSNQLKTLQNDMSTVQGVGLNNASSIVGDLKNDFKSTDSLMQQNYTSYLSDNNINVSTFKVNSDGSVSSNISNNSYVNNQLYQEQKDHYTNIANEMNNSYQTNEINNTINTLQSVGLNNSAAPSIDPAISDMKDQITIINNSYNKNILSNGLNNNNRYDFIGEEGRGNYQQTGPDYYGDRITVLQKDASGNINFDEFNRSNLEFD